MISIYDDGDGNENYIHESELLILENRCVELTQAKRDVLGL
jgi:hypothetical protein